jgi:putative ABC transport system permease protein
LRGAAFDKARRAADEDPNLPQGGITPTAPVALVLAGITVVIAAMVWLLPSLIAKTAGLGKQLPLSGRLALRDAARHRHRTGPATAAIMISAGGTVAMAFTLTNSYAAEAADYVPSARYGDAVVRFMDIVSGGVTRSAAHSPELIRRLEQRLPARGHADLAHIETHRIRPGLADQPTLAISAPTKAGCDAARDACYYITLPVVAVEPSYLDRLGADGQQAAAVLRQGKVVLPKNSNRTVGTAGLIRDGMVSLRSDDPSHTTHAGMLVPASTVAALPRLKGFESAALVSPGTASRLGRLRVFETHLDLTREPSAEELSAAISVVGAEELLTIEEGYSSPAGTTFIALLAAATVVTLLGVAICVTLSAAEGRADLATLAAVGAHPRRRRGLAAAQAWLLGQLGCLLGVGVGGLYGHTAHVAFGSPYFAIPWRELAAILLAVPLFAGALAWLLTRSQLPMVRRLE